jgi:hypothetical protein
MSLAVAQQTHEDSCKHRVLKNRLRGTYRKATPIVKLQYLVCFLFPCIVFVDLKHQLHSNFEKHQSNFSQTTVRRLLCQLTIHFSTISLLNFLSFGSSILIS